MATEKLKLALMCLLIALLSASCAGRRVRTNRGLFGANSAPTARVGRVPTGQEIQSANLCWPLKEVEITSHFGHRQGEKHEGVDLRAGQGTPVFAAQQGFVLYAGSKISGYGRLVIIKHPAGLTTVYAHNSKILVLRGQKVRKGQLISYSGQTGRATGPHLHYEIRSGTVPLDPTRFIASGAPPPVNAPASIKSRRIQKRQAKASDPPPRIPLQRQRIRVSQAHSERNLKSKPAQRKTVPSRQKRRES